MSQRFAKSVSCIALNGRMVVKDELERIWKERAVASVKALAEVTICRLSITSPALVPFLATYPFSSPVSFSCRLSQILWQFSDRPAKFTRGTCKYVAPVIS
jgi:hypothetical protein